MTTNPEVMQFGKKTFLPYPVKSFRLVIEAGKGGVAFVACSGKPVHQSSELVCGGVPLAKSRLME